MQFMRAWDLTGSAGHIAMRDGVDPVDIVFGGMIMACGKKKHAHRVSYAPTRSIVTAYLLDQCNRYFAASPCNKIIREGYLGDNYRVECEAGSQVTALALNYVWLMSAHLDGTVSVWKPANLEKSDSVSLPGTVICLAADGYRTIAGSVGGLFDIRVHGGMVMQAKNIGEDNPGIEKGSVTALALSEDGQSVFYGTKYGEIGMYHHQTLRWAMLDEHYSNIHGIVYSRQLERLLVIGDFDGVIELSAKDGKLVRHHPFGQPVKAISQCPSRQWTVATLTVGEPMPGATPSRSIVKLWAWG